MSALFDWWEGVLKSLGWSGYGAIAACIVIIVAIGAAVVASRHEDDIDPFGLGFWSIFAGCVWGLLLPMAAFTAGVIAGVIAFFAVVSLFGGAAKWAAKHIGKRFTKPAEVSGE